jgi:hypothetical protein
VPLPELNEAETEHKIIKTFDAKSHYVCLTEQIRKKRNIGFFYRIAQMYLWDKGGDPTLVRTF